MSNDWPLGAVELKVLDLEREVEFYEWFGLERIAGGIASGRFGCAGAGRSFRPGGGAGSLRLPGAG